MASAETFSMLIVDDELSHRQLLDALLKAEGYQTLQAKCGADALALAEAQQPDLILLDLIMPDMDGFEVAAQLKASPATQHIFIIVVTSLSDRSTRLRLLEAGVDEVLTKPVDRAELAMRVRNMLRIKSYMDQIAAARDVLTQFKYTLDHTLDGVFIFHPDTLRFTYVNHGAIQQVGYSEDESLQMTPLDIKPGFTEQHFRAMLQPLLDGSLTANAFETVHRHKDGHDIPVEIVLQLVRREGHVSRFIAFSRDISERREAEEQIRNLAFYDTLTQLPNRSMFSDRLGQSMAASKRSGQYGAVMFLDLDNFKPLNDTFGHTVGDLLLVEVAHRITSCMREMDTVARFGGDEFVVLLNELGVDKTAAAAQADIVAEKIRAILAEPYRLTLKQTGYANTNVEHRCSSSIGVVIFIGHRASQDDILKWADTAMYKAKNEGRNQACFFGADKPMRV